MMMIIVIFLMRFLQMHVKLGRGDPVLIHLAPLQRIFFFDVQLLQLRLHPLRIAAGIQQRTDEHISADAGKAVKV